MEESEASSTRLIISDYAKKLRRAAKETSCKAMVQKPQWVDPSIFSSAVCYTEMLPTCNAPPKRLVRD
jgi:hypothetical protein